MAIVVVRMVPPCLQIRSVGKAAAVAGVKRKGDNASGGEGMAVAVVVGGLEDDVEKQATLAIGGDGGVKAPTSSLPEAQAIRVYDEPTPAVPDSDQAIMAVHKKAFKLVSWEDIMHRGVGWE